MSQYSYKIFYAKLHSRFLRILAYVTRDILPNIDKHLPSLLFDITLFLLLWKILENFIKFLELTETTEIGLSAITNFTLATFLLFLLLLSQSLLLVRAGYLALGLLLLIFPHVKHNVIIKRTSSVSKYKVPLISSTPPPPWLSAFAIPLCILWAVRQGRFFSVLASEFLTAD